MSDKEDNLADESNVAEESAEQGGPENPAEPGDAATPQEQGDLGALLEDARNKADENWNLCLRLQAEIDNLRKRSERDLANAHKYALERFAQELLPVRDSLEMGLAAFTAENADPEKLHQGVELTLKLLTTALGRFGITEVDPLHERFNPDFHQAMSLQDRSDVEPNTVVTVVQKGYLLNDRLLRPAMVIVSRAPETTDSHGNDREA
jgi:molecular chaperone GrpE